MVGEGGNRLHFAWSGQEAGPVLVLSHSLGSDLSLWEENLSAWEEEFRILRYDHRGHGKSETPEGDWKIEDFGSDLVRLLDHLEVEEVLFCGVSLGGMVGLWVAENHPSRISRLVVANTSAYTEDPRLLECRIREVMSGGTKAIAEDVLEKWLTAEFREANPGTVERFRSTLWETSAEAYRKTSEAVCGLDLREGLSGIEIPVLVITGSFDQATPKEWGERIADQVPRARLRELTAAHLSNVERAEEFVAETLGFFRSEESAED